MGWLYFRMAYCKRFSTAIDHGTTAPRHGPNVNHGPTAGAARFFACPRLVLLTMGDGRSTTQYFVMSTSVHHATRCALAACGSTFQLLEWQIRPWPLECGDLGKGEFLASCYSS
jgi:hypothetical protein